MPVDFDERRGLSLSFPACCELPWLHMAYGTRDAKELGFDHVRHSEPYREQWLDKQEFISSPGLPPPRETLMQLLFYV